MKKEKRLVESYMQTLLKTIAEQDEPEQPTAALAQPVAQPVAQPTQQPAPGPTVQTKEKGTKLQYLDTIDLYTTAPPANADNWTNEFKLKPQFTPLRDGRIVQNLVRYFPTFKVNNAGAARYSDKQFRIILRGDLKAATELIIQTEKAKTTAYLQSVIIENSVGIDKNGRDEVMINLRKNKIAIPGVNQETLRKSFGTEMPKEEPTKEPDEESGSYESGEKIKKSEVDKMMSQFAESQLIEVKLSRPEGEIRQEAWSKLEPTFRNWFVKEIVADNPKAWVDHHMKDAKGRAVIKQMFAKDAQSMPDVDKEALKIWTKDIRGPDEPADPQTAKENLFKMTQVKSLGYTPTEKQINDAPDARSAKPNADPTKHKYYETLIAMVRSSWEVGQKAAEKFAKTALSEKNPQNEVELYKLALEKNYLPKIKPKGQRESLNLHSYLKNLLLEKKGGELETGKGGEIISILNDHLEVWFKGKGSLAAPANNRTFLGNVFEWFAVKEAQFVSRERKVDIIENKEVRLVMKGDLVMKAEIWVDARSGERGTEDTWTFRVLGKKDPFAEKTYKTPGTLKRAVLGPSKKGQVPASTGEAE